MCVNFDRFTEGIAPEKIARERVDGKKATLEVWRWYDMMRYYDDKCVIFTLSSGRFFLGLLFLGRFFPAALWFTTEKGSKLLGTEHQGTYSKSGKRIHFATIDGESAQLCFNSLKRMIFAEAFYVRGKYINFSEEMTEFTRWIFTAANAGGRHEKENSRAFIQVKISKQKVVGT